MKYAFATSEEGAFVTAIDLERQQAVATLPTGAVPHSMALTPDATRLYVVNRHGSSLTVIDPRGLSVLNTIELSADPMAAAVSPDGRWLAVLGRERAVAWMLNAATGELCFEMPLADQPEDNSQPQAPPGTTAEAGEGATASTHPTWDPDSAGFYAEDNRRQRLVRVDVGSQSILDRVELPSVAHAVLRRRAE